MHETNTALTIGVIGQGWIGKNYADDFERRGFSVVRYALEEPYRANKEQIATCAIVFIAVPTPTTPEGFDVSVVRAVLKLINKGTIAVVKSTLLPGTTEKLQDEFPDIIVLHSPEFLREANAAYDAAHPARNLVGIPKEGDLYERAAELVLSVLPEAPFSRVMSARAAELVKYAGNVFLSMKVVYANMLYDVGEALNVEYGDIREAISADARIGPSHLAPFDISGHGGREGRGAGGDCFIKDFEAFRRLYGEVTNDAEGKQLLDAFVAKNQKLLRDSGKDIDILEGVYGS